MDESKQMPIKEPAAAVAQPIPMKEESSHKQILKSTGIVGGAQVVIILIGIIRTKVLAVLLGPVGVGIAGLYQSVIGLINTGTSFGLSFSAVREIAQAASSHEETKIARSITVLRRWLLFTGVLGALVAILFCKPISEFTFGSSDYAAAIAVLSISIFLGILSSGQLALLQGLRQIGSMAKANVLAAIAGLFTAVPIYWFWGQRGIVPTLVIASAITFFLSWWFSRKIKVKPVSIGIRATVLEGKTMIQLGFFSVLTALVDMGVMYLVRAFIAKQSGIESVGYFTAAWTISNMYMSAIFSAMAGDYYPRLSGVHDDACRLNKMINEQTEIALLIASPVIIGMVSFIGLIVHLFYSAQFGPTHFILSFQLAGDFFKVLSWPIGFVFLVKGKGRQYVLTNIAWDVFYFLFVYIGWQYSGIEATGFAFAIAHIAVLFLTYVLAKPLINFSWSPKAKQYIAFYLPLVTIACAGSAFLTGIWQYAIGLMISGAALIFSFIHLKRIFPLSAIRARLGRK